MALRAFEFEFINGSRIAFPGKFAFEFAVQVFLRVVLRQLRRQKEPFDLVPMPSRPLFYEPRVVDFHICRIQDDSIQADD